MPFYFSVGRRTHGTSKPKTQGESSSLGNFISRNKSELVLTFFGLLLLSLSGCVSKQKHNSDMAYVQAVCGSEAKIAEAREKDLKKENRALRRMVKQMCEGCNGRLFINGVCVDPEGGS